MDSTLWPYGHRASGKGSVSDTVRHAMAPNKEESNKSPVQEEEELGWSHVDNDRSSTERLIPKKKIKGRWFFSNDKKSRQSQRDSSDMLTAKEWMRPYWLGLSLSLTLFAFWLLDSLKDPVFAVLVNGNLDQHQPPAKLCSVGTTLALVCIMELLSFRNKRKRQDVVEIDFTSDQQKQKQDVLDGGGTWTRMSMDTAVVPSNDVGRNKPNVDSVSIHMFTHVGGCYAMVFVFLAHILRFHPGLAAASLDSSSTSPSSSFEYSSSVGWHVLAYILYAMIESFGSLSVATFWSFTNSTLCLEDAERFYGPIIALAQLGAIGGSSMVTTHYWSFFPLFLVATLVICLQIFVISAYGKRFKPTAANNEEDDEPDEVAPQEESRIGHMTTSSSSDTSSCWCCPDFSVLCSGANLILKHNYVLLIMGVSCLYEISLTCLDYQMKLIGWSRFEEAEEGHETTMSFTQFMGHYGQLTNVTCLFLSYICFPYLMRKLGLRYTVRLFPTLLVIATIVAYGALPGNLTVLFLSMSLLKAMTYSIHDPAKEILYLPTSNAIKFRAKFWIDVVGARVAKAMGSTINTYAGSVDRIVRYGSVPSLLTACALWLVCYRAGIRFDQLVRDGTVVGSEKGETQANAFKVDYRHVESYQEDQEDEERVGGPPVDESNDACPERTSS